MHLGRELLAHGDLPQIGPGSRLESSGRVAPRSGCTSNKAARASERAAQGEVKWERIGQCGGSAGEAHVAAQGAVQGRTKVRAEI